MAEMVILPLIQNLGSLLNDEANSLLQVRPEVELLHKELKLMTASLKDADAIYHKSERAKEWVRQLRELAFEAEDTIEVFVYEVVQRWRGGVVRKIIKFPKLLINAHQFRGKIQDINGKITKLKDDQMNYDIKPLERGQTFTQTHQLEVSSSAQKFWPVDVVGLQSEAEKLAKLLMKKESLGRFSVVSITGMGGLGKTTLARKIYDRDDVKRHFDCQAWVHISKEYRMKDVLYNIIKQVMVLTEAEREELASKEVVILEERLSNFLKEKKNSLFLLDDVWSREDWDKLKNTFLVPCDGQQCRVLLTTRDEGIARHADPNADPYKLKHLDEKKSLKLFSKVFFRSPNDADAESSLNSLNKEMKKLATDIVQKCDGLPLAIVVLGGLLLEKRLTTIAEWKKVLDSVDWHLDTSNCLKVLSLSYTELPSHLKSCFLYFGFFPNDAEIERDKLIRLWVAEGFLEPRGNLRMEDVAGDCLEELMQRNLIHVAKWKSNGVPQSFIIHDLLLKLAISEAKESNFLNISTPQKSLNCYRRVALRDKSSEDNMAQSPNHSSSINSSNLLRTLLCFTEMNPSLYREFKLLNVLDLEDAPGIKTLPKEIGKLIFLKYLSFRGTGLKTLPPWVGNLYNLQTLNLFGTRIDEYLPIEILKLEKLRHLLCYRRIPKWRSDDSIVKKAIEICRCSSPPRQRQLGELSHLQTLWLRPGDWIEDGLEMLTDLRDLRIGGYEGHLENFREALSQAIVKLVRLEVLFLLELGGTEIFFPSFSNHVYLYDLYIGGCIRKLPEFNNFPPNLTRLRLANTRLEEDMIVILEKLPKLKELTLDKQPYDGVVMKCSARGFPKLEDLTLHEFHCLRNWIVEEGALPNLRILEMNELYGLKGIPNGLRHVTKLQKLTLAMPKEFLERVKEGGDDWEKIKHVPSINTREKEIPIEISQHLPGYERQWVDIYRGDNPSC
ncbi:probable disease resistance RPP8-like protein 4 [Telopea speciosissima]|uniref:probable disease resistance RPP8-like protein 4 n=1 Tax=Telopea speciosissima TaxID=54955 RepID=UPI001CC8194B|nr:probable disease resistance RPP8-like protein 4 [Telopea speciosissima]